MRQLNERFADFADWATWMLGSPWTTLAMTIALGGWFVAGLVAPASFLAGSFIPPVFASNAWNFPANTGTSCFEAVAECCILAAANRVQRRQEAAAERDHELLNRLAEISARSEAIHLRMYVLEQAILEREGTDTKELITGLREIRSLLEKTDDRTE